MIKKYLLLLAVLASAYLFNSCQLDPYELPAEELYTRSFIKTFGLIDPQQDWNMAQEAEVTVNVGDQKQDVKVYVKSGEKYFLVADLKQISGSINVPIDVPEGSNELIVKAGGREYFTTLGGTVNLSGSRAPGSRAVCEPDITITDYMIFNIMQISPIIKEWVKDENGNYDPSYRWSDYINGEGETRVNNNSDQEPRAYGLIPERTSTNGVGDANYHNPYVVKDFWFSGVGADGITIYPMFWNTNATSHEIGIYYFVDDENNYIAPDTPDCHIVHKRLFDDKNKDPEGQLMLLNEAAIKWLDGRITVSSDNTSLSTNYYNAIKEAYNGTFPGLSEILIKDAFTSSWSTKYPMLCEKAANAILEEYKKTHESIDYNETTYDIDDVLKIEVVVWNYDENNITEAQIALSVPEFSVDPGSNADGVYANASYLPDQDKLAAAKGINVKVPSDLQFGFYLMRNNHYYHSQSKYNTSEYDCKPSEIVQNKHFACTFKHQGSGRQFFSFEDAEDSTVDWDLNDLVFRLDGTYLTSTTDTYTNADWVEKESSGSDEKLQWLVAAEDLGTTDDFDFNDVIFGINVVTTNYKETITYKNGEEVISTKTTETINKKITVQALAAGGTLETYLHYYDGTKDYILGPNNTYVDNTGGDGSRNLDEFEWHYWFGSRTYNMINTGLSTVNRPGKCLFVNKTTTTTSTGSSEGSTSSETTTEGTPIDGGTLLEVSGDFTVSGYSKVLENGRIRGFYITVGTSAERSQMNTNIGDGVVIAQPNPGAAPQMFLIADEGHISGKGWYWPEERQHIYDSYTSFKDWIGDSNNTNWHKPSTTPEKVLRPVDF